jgi:hypothetical protein
MARPQAPEKQSLKAYARVLSVFALAVSFAYLMPSFLYPKTHFGQLGKQTFAAQMIESTAKGELSHGVFPTRHFLEVYENGLVPWAEEVPLYSFMSAGLVDGLGFTPVAAGKTLSLLAFFLVILGFALIARDLGKPIFIFVLVAAIFPVFRLYSVQVMPDLCMTAALVWMIESALRGKFGRAAIFLLIASLFKYYAVFTGFGLGLYYLHRRNWKGAALLGLAVVPCIAYVIWFLKLGIPNPITDSRIADGHGHMSSLDKVLSYQNWARVFLWWFVKNASIPGSMLAVLGVWWAWQKKFSENIFFGCLFIGFLLFPLVFISSFYVHDYYGLQGSIGIALFAAIGLSYLFEKKELLAWPTIFVFLGFSVITVSFMLKLMPDYDTIETALTKLNIPKNEFVLSVSGISKPVITYNMGQDAYIVDVDEWTRPNVQAKIKDPQFKYAFLHTFAGGEGYFVPIEADLMRLGFHRLDLNLNLQDTIFEAWAK